MYTPNLDDQVLLTLMKTKAHIRKLAVQHYEHPFRLAVQDAVGADDKLDGNLYRRSFDQLLEKGKMDGFTGRKTIFNRLLDEAKEMIHFNNTIGLQASRGAQQHHAGSMLVRLLAQQDPDAFQQLILSYRKPILHVLYNQFAYQHAFHEEVISDTLMTLRENARAGNIQLPLRSQLFTYACSIAKNKFRKFIRTFQKGGPKEDLSQAMNTPALECQHNGNTYVDYIQACHPELERLLGPEGVTLDNLVCHLEPMAQQIIRLRYYEGLSHREIGKRLNIKEGTSRKRLLDSLNKWKKTYLAKDDGENEPTPSATQERVLYTLRTSATKQLPDERTKHLHAWSQYYLEPGSRWKSA